MSGPRQIAVVRSYDELLAALRQRATDLNISRELIDTISGLHTGYAGKLLAPVPVKALGRTSMGPLLTAMGVCLVMIEDIEAMAKIAKRHTPRRAEYDRHADESMLTNKRRKKRGFRGSEVGKLLRARGVLLIPEKDRRRIARIAAKQRWERERRRKAEAEKAAAIASVMLTHSKKPIKQGKS
jgi:hypothetical protein